MPVTENLSRRLNNVVKNAATAAGTSAITSSEIDLGGDTDHFLVFCGIGTAAADNTLTVTTSATSGGTFAANGISAVASDGTNTLLVLEVVNSLHQFIKTVVARGTSTTIDFVLVLPYSDKSGFSDPTADWTTDADFARYISPTA